jgi:hypothetical protein
VDQASNGLGLLEEAVEIISSGEFHVKEFDGSLCLEIDMLSQIDLGEATFAKQALQAIVAQLLSDTTCRSCWRR